MIGNGILGSRENSSSKWVFDRVVEETDEDELPETDRLPGIFSGGGEATTDPSSSTSRRPTLLAQSDTRIASAKSGSDFSSEADNPVGRSDQGFRLPRGLQDDKGVGYDRVG